MKKLYILAALLMASTAAHAGNGISFDVNGKHVRVELPKNCDSLSCLKVSAPGVSGADFGFKSKISKDGDTDTNVSNNAPVQNSVPAAQTPAPLAASTKITSIAPAPVVNDVVSAAPAAPASAPAPAAPAPAEAATTPLGIWATEDNKGTVRIEECGPNLCGFAANSGEKILIGMKPSGSKWTGRIHDPSGGSDYDSSIAMKGPNTLKVQGCAFGGMFCGNQTWKRVS